MKLSAFVIEIRKPIIFKAFRIIVLIEIEKKYHFMLEIHTLHFHTIALSKITLYRTNSNSSLW